MGIKIVFPKSENKAVPMLSNGTKIYTDDGHEINGVTDLKIHASVNSVVKCVIEVHASEIENLEGVEGLVIQKPEEDGEQ